MQKEKIKKIILKAVEEINSQLPVERQLDRSMETTLFGNNGKLDSLGLVNLIVIIEQNVEDEFDRGITIADEKAMSQHHSPFRNISTLVDYIDLLLNENKISD